MIYLLIFFALFLIGLVVFREFNRPDPGQFYPPKVRALPEYFSVSVIVEVDEKDGKKAFVKLFEKYGFSGNGPSIEQVIRKNIKLRNIEFDSEGGMFAAYTTDNAQYVEMVNAIKCIEDIKCLDKWLNNARWTLIKE